MTKSNPSSWTPPPVNKNRDLSFVSHHQGHGSHWYQDLYVFLLKASWSRLALFGLSLFFLTHTFFAGLFLFFGPCIKGARPGNWWDAYFFSVQTLSTIGYGGLTPLGLAGNLIVTIESMLGLVSLALATGLVFSKFAKPTARVIFSQVPIIHYHNNIPTLKFRLANARNNNIIEASLRVAILKNDNTQEGYQMQRLHDAKILRDFTPIFIVSWLVLHPIDEESPLYGMSPKEMRENDIRIIITMTGIDGVFSQTIHTHHTYWGEDIVWDVDYVDMLDIQPDKKMHVNYNLIHDLRMIPEGSKQTILNWKQEEQ